jgi:GntR family transcriptional repressor for pyruvate dehydrogenase complex
VREEIITQIEELMASGHLRAGDRLPPERELSLRLGVSRTALREALAALEKIGLIAFGSGGVRYVRAVKPVANTEWFATDLAGHLAHSRSIAFEPLEVRRILEPETARLAAIRAKHYPSPLAEMASILKEQDEWIAAGRPAVDQDIRFHTMIASATGNSIIEQIIGTMNEAMRDWKTKTLQLEDHGAEAAADHWRLWKAIASGDGGLAYEHALRHIELSQELILRHLSRNK